MFQVERPNAMMRRSSHWLFSESLSRDRVGANESASSSQRLGILSECSDRQRPTTTATTKNARRTSNTLMSRRSRRRPPQPPPQPSPSFLRRPSPARPNGLCPAGRVRGDRRRRHKKYSSLAWCMGRPSSPVGPSFSPPSPPLRPTCTDMVRPSGVALV